MLIYHIFLFLKISSFSLSVSEATLIEQYKNNSKNKNKIIINIFIKIPLLNIKITKSKYVLSYFYLYVKCTIL